MEKYIFHLRLYASSKLSISSNKGRTITFLRGEGAGQFKNSCSAKTAELKFVQREAMGKNWVSALNYPGLMFDLKNLLHKLLAPKKIMKNLTVKKNFEFITNPTPH